MACLDDNTVAAFMAGTLSAAARREVELHVEGCADCRQLLAVLMRGDREESSDSTGPTLPSAMTTEPSPMLVRGQQLGRYLLLESIGAGGMGVVYAAYDPVLERKVAVKVVRGGGGPEALEEVRVRLQREGKSIAQLAHPNIVAVFDMGTSDGQVYVAMELVEGGSLKQWLREAKRPWREVLQKFLAAGHGLAAAHRAGLAHRDFKPENVLIGKDGRVRVTDFGLASSASASTALLLPLLPLPSSPPGEPGERGNLDARLTRSGALLGTPAYMAPEQYAGRGADTLSDQFSFCVALWEAVFGERPYTPDVDPTKWKFVEPPPNTNVPPWLKRALLRGLSLTPSERSPTMEVLLLALEADPARTRAARRWLAAGLALAVAAAGGTWWAATRSSRLCTGAAAEVARAWNPAVVQSLATAFTATGAEDAAGKWERTRLELDAWWRTWAATYTEACQATRVRGEQSDQLLGLRMACLSRQCAQTVALLEVFQRADPEVVAKAAEAGNALSPLSACNDTEALLAQVSPPQGAALSAEVEAVRGLLAESQARSDTGQYQEALTRSLQAVARAKTLDYRPVLAEALLLTGVLQEHQGDLKASEQSLLDAISTAEASKHDTVTARAATHLMLVLGARQARYAEAHAWGKLAAGALSRSGGSAMDQAALLRVEGLVHYAEGKLVEAIEAHQQAVALFEQQAPGTLTLAEALNDLGAALRGGRKAKESQEAFRRALDILLVKAGPDSDLVAATRNGMANSYMLEGRFTEAFTLYQQSFETFARRLGPTHFRTVTSLNNLGVVLAEQGRYADALPYFEKVLAARLSSLSPTDAKTADAWSNVGMLRVELGRYDEALTDFEKARGILQGYPLDHFSQAESLLGVAKVALARHTPEQAVEPLWRVLSLCEKKEGFRFDYTRARANFLMGRALVEGRKPDRERGHALVHEARAALEGFGAERFQRDLAEIDGWRAAHPAPTR